MSRSFILSTCRKLIGAALTFGLAAAQAQTLLLDNFSTPALAQSIVSPAQSYVVSTPGTYAGVGGQARDAYYWPYFPLDGAANPVAVLGNGQLQASVTPGHFAELGLGYGSYAVDLSTPNVQGAALHLDLSHFGELQANFAQMGQTTNIVVGLYTQAPLTGPDGNPLYYWGGEINVSPTAPGAAATANVLFQGGNAQYFNFAQVDGIVFIVDRAALADGNGYTLSSLQFAPAVPEPASSSLALLGLVGLAGWLQRRRAQEA